MLREDQINAKGLVKGQKTGGRGGRASEKVSGGFCMCKKRSHLKNMHDPNAELMEVSAI